VTFTNRLGARPAPAVQLSICRADHDSGPSGRVRLPRREGDDRARPGGSHRVPSVLEACTVEVTSGRQRLNGGPGGQRRGDESDECGRETPPEDDGREEGAESRAIKINEFRINDGSTANATNASRAVQRRARMHKEPLTTDG